ncbi:ABC transporter permease [Candidatus Bipolaricaulota bacterium]|nr:ABC transporter permease [Candidatus Bipolaricaulota bacterium]
MRLARELGLVFASLALAFGVGALVAQLSGLSPSAVYRELVRGAFGDQYRFFQTLTQATPIIFTSLSFLIAFRAGLFNIGAEGQLYMGAFFGAWAGFTFVLPPYLHTVVALLVGALVGAVWGFIPGWLRARRGTNEFVSTMMLSYVAIYFTSWLVSPRGPYHGTQWANQTVRILSSAELPRFVRGMQLHWGLAIAGLLSLLLWYFLFRTPRGYEMRAVGQNPRAAQYAGIDVPRTMILALTLAGALAGLGGAAEVLGTHRRFIEFFSPGYGWDGIAGGLIARAHPLAVIPAAILIGALRAGGMGMDRAGVAPADFASVLQGIVIFFVVAPELFRLFRRIRRERRVLVHSQP